jgi:hypothetical protein
VGNWSAGKALRHANKAARCGKMAAYVSRGDAEARSNPPPVGEGDHAQHGGGVPHAETEVEFSHAKPVPSLSRERKGLSPRGRGLGEGRTFVIARRRKPTRQSRLAAKDSGSPRCARDDGSNEPLGQAAVVTPAQAGVQYGATANFGFTQSLP